MKYLCCLLILLNAITAAGQNLFPDSAVIKIQIQFPQPDFWEQLAKNKAAKIDIPATLIVNDSEVFDSVGVRFKGNSSYHIPGDKKPFNISMDSFVKGQNLWGYKTFNLCNAFMDPSFVREKISYDLFRKYMPAGKVGFVQLYLNGSYWGLYVNVEQVNKSFLEHWFGSADGNLYKCDPHGNLTWRGSDPANYKRDYEKKTNRQQDDWSDLVDFIDVLNHSTQLEQELPQRLDVDRALWYMALCNILVNLDSYIFSGHNYYLYNDPGSRQFSLIPWDLNEAFGCFPPRGFTQQQLEQFPVFQNIDRFEFPLIRRLLTVPAFRARYLAHYRTILNHDFHPDSLLPGIIYFHRLVDEYVKNDPKKLYSYDLFTRNLTEPVIIEGNRTAPGLMKLITSRRNFLLSDPDLRRSAPQIQSVRAIPDVAQDGEPVVFRARVSGVSEPGEVALYYKFGTGKFATMQLFDDGAHNDESAGDAVFGNTLQLPPGTAGKILRYYVLAADEQGEVAFFPERAEFECLDLNIQAGTPRSGLVINEFMAANDTTIADPQGDYDDWIELYNGSSETISLQGMYLTDDATIPKKWIFPDTFIAANGYLLIWADDDTLDSPGLHTNFKLNKAGEFIGWYDTDANGNLLIDAYNFGTQIGDVSEGRFPNGQGDFTAMAIPTPNAENTVSTQIRSTRPNIPASFQLDQNYPNPFNFQTIIRYSLSEKAPVRIGIYNLTGQLVKVLINEDKPAGKYLVSWDGTDQAGRKLSSGIYFCQMKLKLGNLFLSDEIEYGNIADEDAAFAMRRQIAIMPWILILSTAAAPCGRRIRGTGLLQRDPSRLIGCFSTMLIGHFDCQLVLTGFHQPPGLFWWQWMIFRRRQTAA